MDEDLQIKKIDALLFLFREEEVGISIYYIKEMMSGKGFEVSNIEMTRYLNQLISDNYIMFTNDNGEDRYIIRIEGLLFDGYEQQILNRLFENNRLENLESELRANRIWTIWLTILIAVGTLLAGVYYVVEICEKFSPILHQSGLYWIWETIPQKKP